jgi:hypothetical protein
MLMSMQNVTGLWHPALNKDALWEYAMAARSLREVFGHRRGLRVMDYGYSLGLSPLLLWMGHEVTLYEVSRRPSYEENWVLEHLRRVKERRTVCAGCVNIWPRPPAGIFKLDEEKKFDAVFSTSTLNRLGKPVKSFVELLAMVRKGGLLFVTTSEEDREPKIREFTREKYETLVQAGLMSNFKIVGGLTQWEWEQPENSFKSLVMINKGEKQDEESINHRSTGTGRYVPYGTSALAGVSRLCHDSEVTNSQFASTGLPGGKDRGEPG